MAAMGGAGGWLAGLVLLAGCSFDTTGVDPPGDGAVNSADSGIDADGPSRIDAAGRPDAAPPPVPGEVRARRTTGAITLDGSAADWTNAIWQQLDIASADQRIGCGGSYANSALARFAALHDDQYLYFFVEVTDDLVNFDSAELFEDDAVSLYLDGAGDASGPRGVDDHEIVVSAEKLFFDYNPGASAVGLSGDLSVTGAGYNVELRLEKQTLGAQLGSALGFDIALSDDDDLGNADADCYGLWFESAGPHCPDCCSPDSPRAWCDTSLYGQLTLL